MSEIYRLVYTSRNLLKGTESERANAVGEILKSSQTNNRRVGVTGALLFNGGYFAQVLEGPQPVVESTFERIQRDPRHSDVSVLQCEPVAERGFPNWSMAFIGHSARGRALWQEMAGRTGFDLARIQGEQLFSTLHSIVLAEESSTVEGPASTPATVLVPAPPLPEHVRSTGEVLDIDRLRAELRERMPEDRSAPSKGHPPAVTITTSSATEAKTGVPTSGKVTEAVMLRAALAEERLRTNELRRGFDEARIALALANEQIELLRRHRDVWAGRARMLASGLCQEPDGDDAFDRIQFKGVAS